MAEHLLFSEHLTAKEVHRPIAETYLGQAHIAGTGPEGKTCRECIFWHVWKSKKLAGGGYRKGARRSWLFRRAPCQDAVRAEESPLQSADPEQGQSPDPAYRESLPPVRGRGARPAGEEEWVTICLQ